MDVFNLAAKLTLDSSEYNRDLGKAEENFSVFGDVLKGNLATEAIVKGLDLLASAAKTAAEGLYNLIKDSVMVYAEYEQLEGGIRKIFGVGTQSLEEYAASQGKSVDEVREKYNSLVTAQNNALQDASEAWQFAGISANDYMTTITTISGALMSSLNYDTGEVVSYSRRAVSDMSDIANTYGMSMDQVSQYYISFSRGLYQTLDTLTAGSYKGTKEGAIQLINEMADLIDIQEELGVTVEKDNLDYANFVNAMSVFNKKMGITGTTINEANTTVTGSINMMKASWENLLIAMGTGEDLDEAFNNFTSSFQTMVDNIIPVVERIIPAIGQIIEKIAPLVEEYLPVLIEEVSPLVADAITIIGGAILDLLGELLPKLGEFLLEKLTELGMWIVENDPFIQSWLLFSELAIEAITALIDWVVEIVNVTWAKIQEIWNFVTPYFTAIWETIKSIFSPVVEWFDEHWRDAWNAIKTIWDVVVDFFDNIWESIKLIFSVVQDVLSGDFQGAWDAIKEIINLWAEYFQGIWDGIKEVFDAVADWFGEKFQAAWDAITAIFEPVVDFFQGIWDSITGVFDGIGDTISGYFDLDWASVGSNIINGIASGVTNAGAALWNAISNAVSYAWNNLLAWLGIASPSKKARDQIGKMWAAGIGLGFEQGMPVDDMVGAVSDAFDEIEDAGMPNFDYDNIDISTLDTGGASGSSYADNGVVINVYATERQDEEEVAREVQRVFVQWENQRKAAYA